ncbi:MAG: FAD-dependent oxidoreductase [Acidobacteriota bacterium]
MSEALQIKDGIWWVGALDPELRVFDIVMWSDYGTTYNAYLVQGSEKTALIETVKEKYLPQYLDRLKQVVDLQKVDYLIMNHTEPDHAGSVAALLKEAPHIKVVASSVALNFLRGIANRDVPNIPVKEGDTLDLGGKTLHFYDVPFLHWPDTIYTYVAQDKVLFTCDSFGSHYSDEKVFNDLIDFDFTESYKYYFDMIIGPFKPHMAAALDKIKELPIDVICTGHGPVLRDKLPEYIERYREWTTPLPPNEKPKVVVSYVSAYGYTRQIANSIVEGMQMMGDFDIRLYDLVETPVDQVLPEINTADALLIGSPTIVGDALPNVWDMLIKLSPVVHGGKLAGAFGSYGWSGEAVPNIEARLHSLRMSVVPGLRVNFKPSENQLEMVFEWGIDFGRKLLDHVQPANKTQWKCMVCGQVFQGEEPPDVCPACGVTSDNFDKVLMEDEFIQDCGETFVIVGAGIAGLSAAEAIRKRNRTAQVKLLTVEPHLTYYRPALSDYLSEELTNEQLFVKDAAWYDQQNIEVVLNAEVKAIDAKDKKVVLADGSEVTFDKLILAAGARPNLPSMPGSDLPGVFVMRSLDDARTVKQAAAQAKSAIIVGGGVLGLEAAWELKSLGLDVTVAEYAPRIMPRQLDPAGSAKLERIITEAGIKLAMGAAAEEITGDRKVAGIKFKDGGEIICDMVIFSVGVTPNIELAKEAGINTNRAIVVDKAMRTSASGIYACGDVAEIDGVNAGLWPVAAEMGRIAGASAAGDWLEYQQPLLSLMLAAFEWEVFSLGDISNVDDCKVVEINDPQDGSYAKYYYREGVLVGIIMIARKVDVVEALRSFGKGASAKADKWRCRRCGYVHDGDEPPDTCPACGAPKKMFDPVF